MLRKVLNEANLMYTRDSLVLGDRKVSGVRQVYLAGLGSKVRRDHRVKPDQKVRRVSKGLRGLKVRRAPAGQPDHED